ncbi:transcriptional regulator [Mycobacterium sp. ACS1612]|uniref:LuxR family transcriptional regulator n=1 Tax=Mycobacterium sp. ACS1612 TaxID=1834117 RepID=UPI0007FD484E|nr:LuxR family transcriptional regulator [Mycobacterium sp. ACS1612]OBF37675.1 transcriptional regulator [Mycobacterium sp. ACS1612]
MSQTDWSDLGMTELLPTGMVTLLLADVEGSTRLWQSRSEEMTAAVTRLDAVLAEVVASHHGVRPVEQGEGDSFVLAFARASDAVGCALDLQLAPLAPLRLRVGVHTGEVQLRDEGNYMGSTINRAARLRDLAHGGQTVLSGATYEMVADRLPDGVWVRELGSHPLRDLPRPERVVQLCHPDLCNEFAPLRAAKPTAAQNLPVHLTRFVGRGAQIADVSRLLDENRLVTLTGAGGAGKTRLAIEVAGQLHVPDGVWYVDLSPITHPEVVPVAVARALGLPDQPGRSTDDTLIRFIGDRQLSIVLDNCEHLLDASASMIGTLLGACPELKLLTTSREPLGIPGEVTFVVPSLSLDDEAIELFTDRARRAQPEFAVAEHNAATLGEICRRLDGMPLAIELAAARVRALTLDEILDGLHDRFRLLTGGARRSVRRQQTLHASVDWSHALLTDTERTLFRRLAVFLGGFDLEAAHAVAGDDGAQRYQILDQLSLLVDKSLLTTENASGRTRYRFLETVRQYALEKLGESGEAITLGDRHRDYYTALAAGLDSPGDVADARRLEHVQTEFDNLRGAFAWSLENEASEPALRLATSLLPLWFCRWRHREGLAWLAAALAAKTSKDDPARVRALAYQGMLMCFTGIAGGMPIVDEALALARQIGESHVLISALIAHGVGYAQDAGTASADFGEAATLGRELGDQWRLSQVLGWQVMAAMAVGDHAAIEAVAREGSALADAIGDGYNARICRLGVCNAHTYRGEVNQAVEKLSDALAEAMTARDPFCVLTAQLNRLFALAWRGDVDGAQRVLDVLLSEQVSLGDLVDRVVHSGIGLLCQAAGDAVAARDAYAVALQRTPLTPQTVSTYVVAALPLAVLGDLPAARRLADEVVAASTGISLVAALASRARVALAQAQPEHADLDAREALALGAECHGYVMIPDTFDCLGYLASDAGNHPEAARLFGMADAARRQTGIARFKIFDDEHERRFAVVRDALGDNDFQSTWDEGATLTIEEAIAYVGRGRGERKRPSKGWASLTPTELNVVRLACDGLGNREIAARMIVSPRTVQAHLSHVYSKLGVTSRVQLAQEASRH